MTVIGCGIWGIDKENVPELIVVRVTQVCEYTCCSVT